MTEASPLPEPPPAAAPIPDLAARFRAEAERVGTLVLEGLGPASALTRVLADTGANRLHWQGLEAASRFNLVGKSTMDLLAEPGRLIFSDHPEGRVQPPLRLETEPRDLERLNRVQVSVGLAEAGIAETGTTVESTNLGLGRVLPILAPVHVVLLSTRDLLATPSRFFARFALGREESARILMTGPSRTADIEKTLVLGVHGPRRHYVILLP